MHFLLLLYTMIANYARLMRLNNALILHEVHSNI